MECAQCIRIFETIGNAFNTPMITEDLVELIGRVVVEQFEAKGCVLRLLSRDRQVLEEAASYGLSEKFLQKGPVSVGKSVKEALEGKVVVVQDCTTDPRIQYPAAHAEEGIRTLVNVPLASRGQVLGVLRLYSAEDHHYTERDLEILRVVASFCTTALVHSMFHKVLDDITTIIRSSQDLGVMLKSIVQVVADGLRIKGCYLQLTEPNGELGSRHVAYGLSEPFLQAAIGGSKAAVAEALKGESVLVLNAREDARLSFGAEVEKEGVTTMLFQPLMILKKPVGIVALCTHRAYEFSEEETSLLDSIGDECALAINNAQMVAAAKRRYEDLADDWKRWVEYYGVYAPPQNT